jgi:hypothetical protein
VGATVDSLPFGDLTILQPVITQQQQASAGHDPRTYDALPSHFRQLLAVVFR